MTENELNKLTEKIIGCAFDVSNTLGCGFSEKVYERALEYEIHQAGLRVETQVPFHVPDKEIVAGEFVVDVIVENAILIEVKATKDHHDFYTAQCLNYLKATRKPICLLLNFGKPKLDIRRYRR